MTNTLIELVAQAPDNKVIRESLIRAYEIINNPKYKKILCAISGGADSDVMFDIIYRCDIDKKVEYVWCDTGLEYQATKDHLKYLAERYNVTIKTYKAIKPIPLTCKTLGQPFLNKRVSDYMYRLQSHGFKWEDKPFEELYAEYPKCKTALVWWCNKAKFPAFNISYNKYLKEFIVLNPPTFKISDKCCKYAKKDVIGKLVKEFEYDLTILGIRKAEGGLRATAYSSCFGEYTDGADAYRPLFWYTNEDKACYEDAYGIVHSNCYSDYGLKRTGCAGCPFGRAFEDELQVIERYEPKLLKAVNNIFGDSYRYTREYRKFCERIKNETKQND